MIDEKRFNRWFNAFILVGMAVVLVLTTAAKSHDKGWDALLVVSAVGSLMGILSTVSSANGKIITFFFGFIDVLIYTAVCFISGKYGNFAMHLLYFLPMQFYGLRQWRKRGASKAREVKARRMSGRELATWLAISLASSVAAYFVLAQFDDSAARTFIRVSVVADAVSMVCNILGQYLMSAAYMEQWIFWIGVNIFSIVMWTVTLTGEGSDYAAIYVIKYSFYLVNSLNGLRIWLNLSRPDKVVKGTTIS